MTFDRSPEWSDRTGFCLVRGCPNRRTIPMCRLCSFHHYESMEETDRIIEELKQEERKRHGYTMIRGRRHV